MQADIKGGPQWKHANRFKFSDTDEGNKLLQILEIQAHGSHGAKHIRLW